jgi:hypothetical protein
MNATPKPDVRGGSALLVPCCVVSADQAVAPSGVVTFLRRVGKTQFLDSRSPTMSVADAGDPFTKPKNGPKSRVAEKPVM